MNLHRNVLLDLATLVDSGRASAESRAMVDEARRRDPTLGAGSQDPQLRKIELLALAKTRQRLNLRSWLMAGGIFLTLAPLSVRGGADGVHFLFADQPMLQIAMLLVGLACWTGWWQLGRSLLDDR
jgi:hypothetical protein